MNIMKSLHKVFKVYTQNAELKSHVGKQELIYFHFRWCYGN